MCATVRPCLGHGVGHDMRASVKPCLVHGIDVDMCASGTMSGTWHRPHHESQCSYSKLMRYKSSYVALMCRQASIGDQGTSDASITLSPEAFETRPYGGHGLVHERVPWLCALKGLLTSEIESQGFCTRACHGRVGDTGHGHGRVPSRVKTLVVTSMSLSSGSHPLDAQDKTSP
ncbi:hypothetical protein F383_03664 [Gossypium arboreum]|uniref:Uncharacterized protein n=1 Tax=Gossypium arboreum TaxID=29729 RepID=A0A0B0NHB3_GOSAR|nr:hypothetical protein F383_03664 [Gossypium arboreum]